MPDPIDVVCRHLAIVAVDGAGDEMEPGLDSKFRLHVDGWQTDRNGYQALVAARWAVEGDRPPLDVVRIARTGRLVMAVIAPGGVVHFGVEAGLIAEAWMTIDWDAWLAWLDMSEAS